MPSEASVIDVTLNARQKLFFLDTHRYVGYGGARGGGKSWAVRYKAVLLALRYAGIKILIVRRTYAELEENHIQPMLTILSGVAKYRDRDKCFTFPGQKKSKIKFGYCDAERDVLRYQGQEYDVIFLDEATQLTEFQFQTFKGCLRGVNAFPHRMYITCNPGGVGHAWVKRLFIDRDYKENESQNDYSFIPAKVYDNTALMELDPEYVKMLESLPYELRKAWLEGSWDVFAGQFFTAWDRDVHILPPFPIPEHWRRYVTMDYGMDMLAAYIIAVDEEGNAYVTAEEYEGRDLGDGHDGVIISEAAERIKKLAAGQAVYQWLAPPDMWASRQESGRSVADIFAEKGVFLTKTSNDRFAGWMAMRERLQVRVDGNGMKTAALRIFPNCVNLIRTLPLMQYDPRQASDAAREPHEVTHAADAIRGFCVYWVESSASPPSQPRAEKLIDKMARQSRRRWR